MKQKSTIFLRLTIFIMAAIVAALCIFALPSMWNDGPNEATSVAVSLIMIGLYATTVPFFIALWQALKLLGYIDKNTAFSGLSVKAIKNIKLCAAAISVFYVGGLPLLFPIADFEDAPGLIIMGAVVACAPIAVAVFAAILEKLLQTAINIQSENDLTI